MWRWNSKYRANDMAITTLAQYQAAFKQYVHLEFTTGSGTSSSSLNSSTVLQFAIAAVGNTTTGVVPASGSSGFPTLASVIGTSYLTHLRGFTNHKAHVLIFDRLWHAGTLLGAAGAISYSFSSQPSFAARLPNASYDGLRICLEGLNVGSSGSVTVTYTNENGVGGRTATASSTTLSFRSSQTQFLPLQAGDRGVQKIDSIVTPAAGNDWNLCIVRPLCVFRATTDTWNNGSDEHMVAEFSMAMEEVGMPYVPNDAALFALSRTNDSSNARAHVNIDMEMTTA
jgi:hypothetical protein